jgi:amidase
MAVNGALATTAGDLALATSVLAGGDLGPADPGRPLRIAVSLRSPVPGARPDDATRAAVEATAALLRDAGHEVVRRDPVIPNAAAAGALARWMAGAHDDADAYGLDRRGLQPRSATHARIGRVVRRAGLVRPATAERFRERTAGFFSDVDLLLTPITNGPPLAARPWHERSFVANITANVRWAPWASAWNLAGVPALVLPAAQRPEGLPVPVQFVGPPGAEGRLLWLAEELERRQPWRRHAPVFDPAAPPLAAPV